MSAMSIAHSIIVGLGLTLLLASALLALSRMAKGPTSLDRSIASDVFTSITIAATGAYIVLTDSTSALPILVVLSLLGFTGPVALARLISNRSAQVRALRAAADAPRWDDSEDAPEDDEDGSEDSDETEQADEAAEAEDAAESDEELEEADEEVASEKELDEVISAEDARAESDPGSQPLGVGQINDSEGETR